MRHVLFSVIVLLAGCTRTGLPVLGQIPAFHLTSETGQPFDSQEALGGKVWVADFMFTNCGGPCPLMSSKFRRLQRALPATVKLVSFTVDPEHDTPPVLAQYARRYHAESGRWHFLTGEAAALHDLSRNAFKLNNVDGSLDHSTRFVLVDRRGRIRGYYLSTEDDELPRLIEDAKRLDGGDS
jgi:protein SCO1/2